MKPKLTTHAAHAVLAVAAAMTLPDAALAANQVGLTPGVANLLPGQTLELTLSGTDFNDLTLGGGVMLQWNPAVLDLESVVVDASTWEFARSGGVLDAAAGTLSDLYFASFIGHSGSIAIATLRFVADGPGQTDVTLAGAPLFPFSDGLGEVMSISYTGASVAVSAVPEPASTLLLLAGLCGLAWQSRRRPGFNPQTAAACAPGAPTAPGPSASR